MDSARAFLRCAWVGSAGDEPSIVASGALTPSLPGPVLARASLPGSDGPRPVRVGIRADVLAFPLNRAGASAPAAFLCSKIAENKCIVWRLQTAFCAIYNNLCALVKIQFSENFSGFSIFLNALLFFVARALNKIGISVFFAQLKYCMDARA
jgi:hypothetical protein